MSWKVPTDEEIKTLEEYLGMTDADDTGYRGTDEGSKIAGHYSLWDSGDLRDDANFGDSNLDFPASGYRYIGGNYGYRSNGASFWSSTESGVDAWRRNLYYNLSTVERGEVGKALGFSVRCFREATSAEQSNYDDFEVLTDFYKGNDDTLYDCVKIGTQIWLAENLRETKFANGDTITLTTSSTSTSTPYRYIYDDESTVDETYGYLYNWPAVDDNRGIAGEDTLFIITRAVDNIKETEVDFNGYNIKSETERGFVYDTSSYADPGNTSPALSDYSNVENETGSYGTGSFSLTTTGLTAGTKYYVRAYAYNSTDGYIYGEEVEFIADEVKKIDTIDSDFGQGTHTDTRANNNNLELNLVYSLEDSESFETNLGDWVNDASNVSNWLRESGSTGSSGTGPSSAYSGSYYIYVETSSSSSNSDGNTDIIEYDLGSSKEGYLDFYYHQYGTDQGTLYLEGWDGSSWNEIWSSSGNKGDQWNHIQQASTGFTGYSKLRFRNVAVGGYHGDVALDLIKVYMSSDYETSGNYESDTLSTESLNSVGSGTISWNETLNSQSLSVETNVSTDGGSTWEGWTSVNSGDDIPDITSITTPADGLVKYKVSLSGDGSATPELNDITLTVTYSSTEAESAISINIGDTWKELDTAQINIGDSWKDVESVKINIGDTWKDIF